jgi:iron complex outermembrane receptor protein
MVRLRWLIFIASIFSVLIAPSAQAEVGLEEISDGQAAGKQEPKKELHSVAGESLINKVQPVTKMQQLSEVKRPRTNAQMLAQSPASSEVIQVTGVQANPTDNGVEVILQTTKGEQLQITNNSAENNFIADIPNAQLRLPSGDGFTFRSQNPIEGITEITVTNLDTNTIRVTVAGETGLPTVELFDGDEGLILGFTPAATAMQPESVEYSFSRLCKFSVHENIYTSPYLSVVLRNFDVYTSCGL